MTPITALGNSVLFQFLDETRGSAGSFSERTRSGLIVPSLAKTQKSERWGQVVAVGPDAMDVLQGDFILIEPLMWTKGVPFEGEKIWKTNPDKIMAVTNDLSLTLQF